ncbi:MAG TPA: hypothetical protein VE954_30930 [Oligoflexus sp.]|uniref:hypothetical protein n=1 Tax=Oligoflexus sp. TaxID=1971216 RepID=UPI002D36B158|nr:hypothetical protein [Oligoflexus sp.]HYX37539.1 hypothetical protein [Oligoflexus sp.]
MDIVTQRILQISLVIGLSCHGQISFGQDDWTPERVLRMPTADDSFDLSQFIKQLAAIDEARRQEWIHEALQAGYVPSFLRQLKRVHSRHAGHELSFWVLPDYLSVGDNDSYLHVPMNGRDALSLAVGWNMYLPTKKMVDLIYKQAGVLLPSVPLDINHIKDPLKLWLEHEDRMDQDLQKYAIRSGWLQAGHMKDVVMSPRLLGRPERGAIYGWQGTDGQLLQNLATSIKADYADYSMGVRLVAPYCLVDGQWMPLADVLRNPELAPLLSDEGAWDVDQLLKLDPLPAPPQRKTPANLMVQH